ncbi:SNRNP27 domain-containing protein [Mycena venus]|uniref:SNRNP27 domain-containing protein n=1 Tax=Mycena venus TaxID=2733690 RepID=A0A8H6XC92_9AGAR|nr:SNRNP27 domain-containing protein [Mycena venus]
MRRAPRRIAEAIENEGLTVSVTCDHASLFTRRMSSRRDRSWERNDRPSRSSRAAYRDEPRRRSSRSRSPRRGDRDRRGSDRRDHRYDDRRDSDRRRRDEHHDRDRDQGRSRPRRDDERDTPRTRSPNASREPEKPLPERDAPRSDSGPSKRLNLDPDAPDDPNEEGEEMEMDDEAGMMAMMGLNGFGTTKGKHIEGNQEGAVSVKKQRTWRQYMNRRGGFNRPLDKIK